MSDELKLCPLCKDNRIEIEPYDNQGSLWCKGCGVLLTAKVFDDGRPDIEEKVKSTLAEIWNTRPIEDALRARAEKAEAMVKTAVNLMQSLLPEYDGVDFDSLRHDRYARARKFIKEWEER